MNKKSAPRRDAEGITWDEFPFCEVPGCEFGVCAWTGEPLCYWHSMEKIGLGEIRRRYEETHDFTWEEFQRDE